MSTIDLMILGLLKYRSSNAYEMVKVIETYKINKWIRLSAPTVYQNLKKLHEKGFLFGETVREGDMPEKTYYTLTQTGEKLFVEMMEKYASCPPVVHENYLPFISNLVHIRDREEGLRLLLELESNFIVQRAEIEFFIGQMPEKPTLYDKAILFHYEKIINAKLEWIADVIKEYKQKGFGFPIQSK